MGMDGTANSQGGNLTNTTSKPQDLFIRRVMFVLAKNWQFRLPGEESIDGMKIPSLVDIWVAELRDVELPVLEAAFKKLLNTWKPEFGRVFPSIGDLRALIARPVEIADLQEAEREWQWTVEQIYGHYQGDIGWMRKNPLSGKERVLEGVSAAGGVAAINEASNDDLVWRKKEFISAYLRTKRIEKFDAEGLLPVRGGIATLNLDGVNLAPKKLVEVNENTNRD